MHEKQFFCGALYKKQFQLDCSVPLTHCIYNYRYYTTENPLGKIRRKEMRKTTNSKKNTQQVIIRVIQESKPPPKIRFEFDHIAFMLVLVYFSSLNLISFKYLSCMETISRELNKWIDSNLHYLKRRVPIDDSYLLAANCTLHSTV